MSRMETGQRRHRTRNRDGDDDFDADLPDNAGIPARSRGPLMAADDSDEWEKESTQYIFALLGGNTRKGTWSPASDIIVVAVMGGVPLDFREADLLEGETVVTILTIMGGVDVKVPPDVHVRCEGLGLLGGFSHTAHRATDPDAPTIVFRGLAVMGGVDVKVRD